MLLESRVCGNLKVFKECPGIAGLIIVGTKHLGRHGLAEATAAGNTTETALRVERTVDNGNQSRFIHVFPVPGAPETRIAHINVHSHNVSFLFLQFTTKNPELQVRSFNTEVPACACPDGPCVTDSLCRSSRRLGPGRGWVQRHTFWQGSLS